VTYGPGIHAITPEEYHQDPCTVPSLSASIADKLVNATPMHARWAHPRLNPSFERAEKPEWDQGNLAHTLLLEGHAERVQVLDFNDWRTKDAKAARDEAYEADLIPVLAKTYERVEVAVAAIRAQLMARDIEIPLLTGGKPEQMLVWEERGVTCRALVDWLHDSFLAIDDLKTTSGSANPVIWSKRQLKTVGADIQVPFYCRGVKALTGKEPEFRYIIAELEPPFAISAVALAPTWMELGEAKVERAIERWRECTEHDDWPGYPAATYYAEAPAWAELEFMELDAEVMTS
jgi:hypothetical protein